MRISDWSSDVCSSDLSALATVVGFPDLVNVFMGTSLNQTGRAVEIVVMTAAVYLTLTAGVGLVTSWYERRVKLVERSEEHTSELQSLMRISYAVFCLKKKQPTNTYHTVYIQSSC